MSRDVQRRRQRQVVWQGADASAATSSVTSTVAPSCLDEKKRKPRTVEKGLGGSR